MTATYNKDHIPFNKNFGLISPNETVHSGCTKPGKQDSEERYWRQQFCQMARDISVPLNVDHLQRLCQIFLSHQTEMVRSI